MNFGEKLFQLRKEKGLSQEALADEINTTRQAISKWENNQGYPETEKLLVLGRLFDVSIDYLLKEEECIEEVSSGGYYVSREKAESWLMYESQSTKTIALGISLIILSGIPFLLLGEKSIYGLFGAVVLIVIGISMILYAVLTDSGFEYKSLKHYKLIFDKKYIIELKEKYRHVKKKYICMFIFFPASTLLCGFFVRIGTDFYHMNENTLIALFLPIISLGFFMFIYAIAMIDAYELLVYNEEHMNKITTKLLNKIRNKF
ncbi:helix-turn-helix domain-containing protein [Candidatus Stoquefichus massiliensis]|uniref:helix-turn-helix domain-containing protein n=1 Tax=Candidatus Stoquefichus massiliensis TaxID=1470350 RepID=UPI000486150A|nr:helix-turn-helix transcriptional regulator [Candidatus Stoquefichus massiliensis]